jgi:tRNA threonylcarbamoyladenosine biosynthesis protein TsaE
MRATYITKSPEETINLGERLAYRLCPGDCVLLYGDLGSGKTHFVKGVARGLGITNIIKSPTFAYINKYIIGPMAQPGPLRLWRKAHGAARPTTGYLFHYDLYRLSAGDDLTSIGLVESLDDDRAINIVEWADRMLESPKKHIGVYFETKNDHHKIQIRFVDPETVMPDQIESFLNEWLTPVHVQGHIKKVTEVAMKIAEAYMRQGEIINLNLLYPSAMMHDIARVCDFYELDKSNFKEKITKEKLERWEEMREKYKGMHHADIAYDFFRKLGYKKTAECVYIHKSRVLAVESERIDTLEKKIMYYSDKRVKHEEVVPLKERFRDGWERYGVHDDTGTKKLFKEVEKRTFTLEKELFDGLDIKPEDL